MEGTFDNNKISSFLQHFSPLSLVVTTISQLILINDKKKEKVIQLQARCGTEGG